MKKLRSFRTKVVAVMTAVLMAVVSFCLPSGRVAAENLNTSVTYDIYTMSGGVGTYSESYTLSSVSTITASASARKVFGDDTRYADNSKPGVVRIHTADGYSSTGFVVDDHIIATAAHCVYTKISSTKCYSVSSINIYGTDGEVIETISSVQEVHIPHEYITSATKQTDYALIKVKEDLSDYEVFNLGVVIDGFAESGATVSVTGFPSDLNFKSYTGTGSVTKCQNNIIYYKVDTEGGDSGGPIYLTSSFKGKTYYTVIGIHAYGGNSSNCGACMNTNLLQFYKNNPNI